MICQTITQPFGEKLEKKSICFVYQYIQSIYVWGKARSHVNRCIHSTHVYIYVCYVEYEQQLKISESLQTVLHIIWIFLTIIFIWFTFHSFQFIIKFIFRNISSVKIFWTSQRQSTENGEMEKKDWKNLRKKKLQKIRVEDWVEFMDSIILILRSTTV